MAWDSERHGPQRLVRPGSAMVPQVVVDVMAKNVARDRVRVKCTERTLEVVLLDEAGQVEFALPVRLWGRVQPGQVRVEVLRPKVEVAMRKADMADWKQLEAAGEGERASEWRSWERSGGGALRRVRYALLCVADVQTISGKQTLPWRRQKCPGAPWHLLDASSQRG